MASITVTLDAACAGGNHLSFTTTGAKSISLMLLRDEALAPVTDEETAAFVRCLIKLGKVGRTNGQLAALFQAGVTVSV